MLNQVYSSEYKKLILAHVNQPRKKKKKKKAYATVIFLNTFESNENFSKNILQSDRNASKQIHL